MFEGDFPSGQVVKTLHFHSTAGGMCSIGGWGAETPHVAWSGQGKKKFKYVFMYWIFILTLGYYHYPILKIRNWGTKGSLQNEWILKFNLQYPRIVRCAVLCLVAQSCPTLYDPTDCNLPGSSVHGILQARIPEWVAMPFFRGSSWPKGRTQVSCIAGDALPSEPSGKPRVVR